MRRAIASFLAFPCVLCTFRLTYKSSDVSPGYLDDNTLNPQHPRHIERESACFQEIPPEYSEFLGIPELLLLAFVHGGSSLWEEVRQSTLTRDYPERIARP